jgi:hypothetical protein
MTAQMSLDLPKTLIVSLAAGVALAMPAYAASTDDLRDLERFEGQLIYVQLVSAEEVLARLVTADDTVLVVTVGGTRRDIASSRIHQVSIRGDRLRNGIQIGAGIGAVWGILGTQGGVGHPTVGVALMTALGAAVGAWVDARHVGRTVVYRSSRGLPGRLRNKLVCPARSTLRVETRCSSDDNRPRHPRVICERVGEFLQVPGFFARRASTVADFRVSAAHSCRGRSCMGPVERRATE